VSQCSKKAGKLTDEHKHRKAPEKIDGEHPALTLAGEICSFHESVIL
jgi:hypothetical protein